MQRRIVDTPTTRGVEEWPERNRRVVELLRAFAADYTYVNRHLAAWLGVHSADGAAYAEILYAQDRGAPLTPLQLSRQLGMTSGATTALLNRLEAAGLVVRSRESQDRRRVTLRSDPAIRGEAPLFFGPLSERLDAALSAHDEGFMDDVSVLLERIHDAMANFISIADDLPPRTRVRSE